MIITVELALKRVCMWDMMAQRRRGLQTLAAKSCNFPTDSCKE